MALMKDLPGIDETGAAVFECSDDESEAPPAGAAPAPEAHADPDVVVAPALGSAEAGRVFGAEGLERDCGISGLERVLQGLKGVEAPGVAEMQKTVLGLQHEVLALLAKRAPPTAPRRADLVSGESLELLEQKVKALEGAVGGVGGASSSQSVLNMVTLLDSRTTYLEPAALKAAVAKQQKVGAVMDEVVQRGELGEFAKAAAGKAALAEVNKRTEEFRDKEHIADPIPHLVDRLMTLRLVHERANAVSSQVRAVAALREATDASLKTSRDTLAHLAAEVPAAAARIEANNAALGARMARLSTHLQLLEAPRA